MTMELIGQITVGAFAWYIVGFISYLIASFVEDGLNVSYQDVCDGFGFAFFGPLLAAVIVTFAIIAVVDWFCKKWENIKHKKIFKR